MTSFPGVLVIRSWSPVGGPPLGCGGWGRASRLTAPSSGCWAASAGFWWAQGRCPVPSIQTDLWSEIKLFKDLNYNTICKIIIYNESLTQIGVDFTWSGFKKNCWVAIKIIYKILIPQFLTIFSVNNNLNTASKLFDHNQHKNFLLKSVFAKQLWSSKSN